MKILKATIAEYWFYHFPVLISIYPIIFIYSNNVQELSISQIFVPGVIAIIATILCWICLSVVLKDTLKAGIITSIFVISFYSYGTFFDWVDSLNVFTAKHRHMLPIFFLITAYLGYFVYRIKNTFVFPSIAKILTVMISLLIILNVVTALPYEIKKIEFSQPGVPPTSNQEGGNFSYITNTTEYPDIFYIVLDEYASSSTIKEIWGYDNSEFENYLEEKGFFVASNSRVRKADTLFSISSTLNMEYVDENSDKLVLFSKINNNRVMDSLKKRGYSIIVIDGIKEAYPNKGKISADYEYSFDYLNDRENVLINENEGLTNIFIQKTMLKPFSYIFEHTVTKTPSLFAFEKISTIGYNITPKFVYIHINSPHAPFVFDSNGKTIEPTYANNWKEKKYYLGQYIFATHQIQQSVNNLLINSKKDPIIIIQSDHGPRPYYSPKADEQLEIPTQDTLKVFNAMYLPDGSSQYLYANITPVNTFRFIFNHTFHDDYELLEDQ